MGQSKAYKYRYELEQFGPTRIELFGTDRKMTNDQLELSRRNYNDQSMGRTHVVRIWLVNQRTGKVVARSSASNLPRQPLFEVVAASGAI